MENEKYPEMHATSGANSERATVGVQQESKPERPLEKADIIDGPTNRQRFTSHLQYGTLCFTIFAAGWSDSSMGPLLPRMREVYDISYTAASLVFVLTFAGFFLGGLLNVWLQRRLAFGKTLVLGCAMQIVACGVQAAAPPFPVLLCFTCLSGLGFSLQDAQANGFVGSLSRHKNAKMNFMQTFYALVGVAAPLVSVRFANMEKWSFHYLVGLGLAAVSVTLQILAFRFKGLDDALEDGGEVRPVVVAGSENGGFVQIAGNKNVHLLSFFMLSYLGAASTTSAWIVTYLIEVRNGRSSSRYIASGFQGGVAVGRLILVPLNRWVGERLIQFVCISLALTFELVVWLVPSLAVNAVMMVSLGIALGPIYSITIIVATQILPRHIFLGGIGWIIGFGTLGSAGMPLIAGLVAQKFGIKNVPLVVIALVCALAFILFFIPKEPLPTNEALGKENVERADAEKQVN